MTNDTTHSFTAADILPEDYQFNLCDFALFLSVMKNRNAYQDTLSIILDEDDLELTEVKVEQVILNRIGKRAIRLDAWARDSGNRYINTEMQLDSKKDDLRRRSRFYQGLMDTPLLKSGKDTLYRNLPSTIIIFITMEDIFSRGLAQYTFTEQCEEIAGLKLEDGTTKLFLNMSSRNGRPELVSLLQYMKNTTLENPEILVKDDRLLRLDTVVQEVRQSEEWEAVKMNILEIGIEQGRKEEKEYGIQVMIQDNLEEGVSPERICLKLCRRYGLDQKEAEERIRKYFHPEHT